MKASKQIQTERLTFCNNSREKILLSTNFCQALFLLLNLNKICVNLPTEHFFIFFNYENELN